MKRFFALILVALALSLTAFAQTADLSGNWTVEWLQTNGASFNPRETQSIALTNNGTIIGGTYVNDAKESCSVKGTVMPAAPANDPRRSAIYTVQCSTFKIVFYGFVAIDNLSVTGTYVTSGGKYGEGYSRPFKMRK